MGRGTITQIPAGKIGAGQQRARWSNGVDEANGQEKFGGNPDTAFIGGRDPVSGDRDGVRGKYATSQCVFGCQRAVYQRGERAGGGAADLLWPRGRVLWRGCRRGCVDETGEADTAIGVAGDSGQPGVDVSYARGGSLLG